MAFMHQSKRVVGSSNVIRWAGTRGLLISILLALLMLWLLRLMTQPVIAAVLPRNLSALDQYVLSDTETLLVQDSLNDNAAVLDSISAWFSDKSGLSSAAAWGDVDNDGDLDLAIADWEGANRVYLNVDGMLETDADWTALDGSGYVSTDVAWGDVDGDGDLDLAAAYGGHARLYYNDNGRLRNSLSWYSTFNQFKVSTDVAWGDMNNDGYLDLVIGNSGTSFMDIIYFGQNEIYFNNGAGGLNTTAGWLSVDSVNTNGIALGDINNDGFLDIVAANSGLAENNNVLGSANVIYYNAAGNVSTTPVPFSPDSDRSNGVSLGDMNGDGYLDVAIANMPLVNGGVLATAQNKVYLNNAGVINPTAAWTTTLGDLSQDVAWGDADADGDLDLAVAVQPNTSNLIEIVGGQNRLYLNHNGMLETDPSWSTSSVETTAGVAWGDVNEDGLLDLAVANLGSHDKIYLNHTVPISTTPSWSTAEEEASLDVAWGDYDDDGDLDLAVANNRAVVNDFYVGGENRIYINEGGQLQSGWSSTEQDDTFGVAWGDVDGDGTLELAVANGAIQILDEANPPSPNRLYSGLSSSSSSSAVWSSTENDDTFQVAWGDVDGDGDLDLAAANSNVLYDDSVLAIAYQGAPNRVYINHEGSLENTASWVSDDNDRTLSVAWGDVDGDGDLDLAVGNARAFDSQLKLFGGQNKLYLNENGTLQNPAVWASHEFEDTRSVAWGDVDGDGDLDLAVGNGLNPNRVYYNIDGQLQRTAGWFSLDDDDTFRVVWGDMDGDGDLDLYAANNNGSDKIYFNADGVLQRTAGWVAASNPSTGASLGDVDGDGDLDVAVSSLDPLGSGFANHLYIKQSPAHPFAVNQSEGVMLHLYSTPVDVGHSGALAAANGYSVATVREGVIPISYTLFHPLSATFGSVQGFYSLDGGNNWLKAVPAAGTQLTLLSSTPHPTPTLAATHVYEWDTVASGVLGQSDNVVFRLEAYLQNKPSALGTYQYFNTMPGPFQRPYFAGQTLPFRVRGTQVRVLSGTVPISNALVYRLPEGQTVGGQPLQNGRGEPFRTDDFGYLQGRDTLAAGDSLLALVPVTTTRLTGGAMSFDGAGYLIRNPVLDHFPQDEITVAFWMQGDGATATRGTPFSYATHLFDDEFLIFNYNNFSIHREFSFLSTGVSANDGEWHHIAVTWRGSDGQARLYKDGEAVYTGTLAAGTTLDPGGSFVVGQEQDSVEGDFQNFQAFKGLMDEFEVWSRVLTAEEIQEGIEHGRNGNEDGLVIYWLFDEEGGKITRDSSPSNSHARLEGATRIGIPGGYTVYATNGQPQETTVTGATVTASSVQTISVSSENPLILFDIDVSLEWDASQDPSYLDQLEFDLQKASAYLYDFTDGQVALGDVTVSQNADNWLFSDVVVRSTNRLRPFAIQGGVTLTPTIDPDHPDVVYGSGQVSMGSTWNRYGNAGQNLGGDWPVILAHELSHYLLYVDDTYLGLSNSGLLIPVNSCSGSAMGDVYLPNNTEFLTADRWLPNCENTLANRTLQRSEWETLQLWYPWLNAPQPPYNAGPMLMPFNFTEVSILEPEKATEALVDPTFYIDYADAAVSSSEAAGFLLRELDAEGHAFVVSLGSPATGQNRLLARGAQPGDRLCVFDPARLQYGCEIVQEGDNRLALENDASWKPLIQVSPINSATLDVQVTLAGDALPLWVRIFPEVGLSTDAISLTERAIMPDGSRLYSNTVSLEFPALIGHLQVWVDEPADELSPGTNPRRETIVAYGIGGNPGLVRGSGGLVRGSGGLVRGSGGLVRGSGGLVRGSGGLVRGSGGLVRGSGAPLLSPDGQFILFTENPADFAPGELYAVQQLFTLPTLPTDKTSIGPGYRLVASPNVTRVLTGSVSFQYLGVDVLNEGISEDELTIHFWDGSAWQALESTRDSYYNLASADSAGEGIYALLAGTTIPHIDSIAPELVINDADTALLINGMDFLRPVTVQIASAQGTYTLPLAAVSTTAISATVPAGLPAAEYQLTVINGDGGVSPQAAVLAIFDPAQACFYDFFDSGTSQWQISGAWGIVELSDGNFAMTDSPLGNYNSAPPAAGAVTTSITSPPFSLEACAEPVLTFDHEFVLAQGNGHQDIGRVEISDDGTTWATLASYSGGGVFGPPTAAADAPLSPEWDNVDWRGGWFDLSAYSGQVRLRFILEVDEAVADKGWLIDNVFVRTAAAAAPTADLQVDVAYQGPATIEAGEWTHFTVTATNAGPDVLPVTVTAEAPAGAMGSFSCSDSCQMVGNQVTWELPTLFTAQTLTMALQTDLSYSDTLDINTTITTNATGFSDTAPSNNQKSLVAVQVVTPSVQDPTADLAIGVVYQGAATITAGDMANYSIQVANNGPSTLPVVVNVTVPVAAVEGIDCANNCAVVGGTITWLLPSFTGNQTLALSITTAETYSGTVDLLATVSSPTSNYVEINGANNQIQLSQPLVNPPEEPFAGVLYLPVLRRP